MKVIDNKIGERGLSRILVENDLGDLKVKVGSEEIICVKSILMNGNSTFRKLLSDDQCNGVLELYEKCEIRSFLEIEKYYSGGIMELNDNNIIDILRFSIYYNDNRIMRLCNKYLKNHLNDEIMIEIFEIFHDLNVNNEILNQLQKISEKYLSMNGFKYLNDDKLLLKLNLKSLKFILSNEKLIIKNESWLLNRLLKWYKVVLKENEANEEELNDFIRILKYRINLFEIKVDEIDEENLLELKELNIEINEYLNNHIHVNIDEIKSAELMKIIHKYCVEEEEICLNENVIKILNQEIVKEEMIKLLFNEDIKVVEIILNIIIEMKMNEIIPSEIKNKLLRELLCEYGRNKRNRTLKCLCLFVDDKKSIITMEYLCGKEISYKILNNEYYLNSKSKKLLIKYIQEMKLSEKDEEEMSKIINDKELLKELKFKEITSFSYPQSQYSFSINEEISIIPSFDETFCEFTINPSLPDGIILDSENGIIHGKVENPFKNREYEIMCKNVKSEKKFKISLEFVDKKFTELSKSDGISISNNGKLITNTNGSWNHCYLNLKIENGINHIKYKFHLNGSSNNSIMLGLSTNNTYSGINIFNQSTVCNYCAWSYKSVDITSYCHIGTIVNKNPNFNNHGDNSIYEVIVDMNKREFWISHNNSSPVILVKDLPSPLYPYATVFGKNTSVELLSESHQN